MTFYQHVCFGSDISSAAALSARDVKFNYRYLAMKKIQSAGGNPGKLRDGLNV